MLIGVLQMYGSGAGLDGAEPQLFEPKTFCGDAMRLFVTQYGRIVPCVGRGLSESPYRHRVRRLGRTIQHDSHFDRRTFVAAGPATALSHPRRAAKECPAAGRMENMSLEARPAQLVQHGEHVGRDYVGTKTPKAGCGFESSSRAAFKTPRYALAPGERTRGTSILAKDP